jgi:hypothetical protein
MLRILRSDYFFNNHIRSIIKQAVCRPLINFNSRSKRFLDSLNEPPPFEQACIFGERSEFSIALYHLSTSNNAFFYGRLLFASPLLRINDWNDLLVSLITIVRT